MGNQQRSAPESREIIAAIHNGAIGKAYIFYLVFLKLLISLKIEIDQQQYPFPRFPVEWPTAPHD